MTGADDWQDIARACVELPLPDLLDFIDSRLPGSSTVELWLWDIQRHSLAAVRSGRRVERDDSSALLEQADAFRSVVMQGEDLGLLTIHWSGRDPGADDSEDELDPVADILADLLAISTRASEAADVVPVRRRSRTMSLAAEMQWSLLPPGQLRVRDVTLSGTVEPAYETGGDVFDYALGASSLFLGVLDARGHGLRASTTATVATGAMRKSRRQGAGLADVAAEIAASINAVGADHEFVSTVLVELDLKTWTGRWLSAGHLPPLLVDADVTPLDLEPALPLGMVVRGQASEPVVRDFVLAPNQSLVLYSDGVIENTSEDDGLVLGEERFHEALVARLGGDRNDAAHLARAVLDDLLNITGPVLRDDATLMVVSRTAG